MSRKALLAHGLKAFLVCIGVVSVIIVGSEAKTESIALFGSRLSDLMAEVQGYVSRVSVGSWTSPMNQSPNRVSANADHMPSTGLWKSDPVAPAALDACMGAKDVGEVAVAGDRLQLRFFENATFSPSSDAGASQAKDIAFERLDLSGVYEVGRDGTVSLPFIGRVELGGRDLPCIESTISQANLAATRAQISVSATFATRPPVIVNGAVRAPGAYQFSPGMTVGALLALAGEPAKGGIDQVQQRMRLLARQSEINRSALGVRIEWHRLKAALAGRRELRLASDDRLRGTMGLGSSRISSETAALDAELDAIEALEAADRSELADLDERIAAYEKSLSAANEQYVHQSRRLGKVRDLQVRGVASMKMLEISEMNTATVAQIRRSVENDLLQLRSSRRAAEHRAKVAAAERRQRLTHQIRDLEEEYDALVSQRATVETELAALQVGDPESSSGPAVAVVISRDSANGVLRLDATPETELFPNDLVTVSLVFPTQSHASLPRLDRVDDQLAEIAEK